jgi:pyruvate formate lyase activating enzyme
MQAGVDPGVVIVQVDFKQDCTMPGTEHEAMLWKPADDGVVDCFLCAHRCHIAPGKRGLCQVRENSGGRLVTLVYGRLIAQHVDPIEKKPFFHFLPGSQSYSIAAVGCNFQCGFCQNWQISQYPQNAKGAMPGKPVAPPEVVAEAQAAGCASISYTYTEPTIFFEFARDVGLAARQAGLRNNFVTNGFMTPETLDQAVGWLDAANVDLKAGSDAFYRKVCKGRLEPVKETIRRMHAAGIWVEVTTLLVTGENDSEDDLKGIAEFLAGVSPDMPWHVSRYHPDFQMTEPPPTPVQTIEKALEIGRRAGLKYVYAGNVVGMQDTVCPACGETVLARTGFSVSARHLKGSTCGGCGAALPLVV